jgi:predicted acylesterase/phospholipase RssA
MPNILFDFANRLFSKFSLFINFIFPFIRNEIDKNKNSETDNPGDGRSCLRSLSAKKGTDFQRDLSTSKTYLVSLIANKYKYLDINNLSFENRDKFSLFFEELNEEFDFIESNLSQTIDGLASDLEYFKNVKILYGTTALMLSGGVSMGTHHIGVMKCLNDNSLMPKIVCGSSSGAIMASIACTKSEHERTEALKLESIEINMIGEKDNTMSPLVIFLRRLKRFLTKGVVFDIEVLEKAMKQNLGPLTFLESFKKTGYILNISISFGSNYEMPKILNHLTAPNVLIWSAVVVSCSVPKFFEPCSLYCKNNPGEITPWYIHNENERWLDGSVENDIPGETVKLFFGANNLIVSQVNPHIYPFVLLNRKVGPLAKLITRMFQFISFECNFRINQLSKFVRLPKFLQIVKFILQQKYMGNVNIIHNLSFSDYWTMFSPCTYSYVQNSIKRGEEATEDFLISLREVSKFEEKINGVILRIDKGMRSDG